MSGHKWARVTLRQLLYVRVVHLYRVLLIGDTQIIEVFVLGLGAGGLLHIKPQLEPETRHHLQGHRRTASTQEAADTSPPHTHTSSLPPSASLYLSGGVADTVQGEQVGGVRLGVILGDGDGERKLEVL